MSGFLGSLIDDHRKRISAVVPGAVISVSGSASVPGLPANDLDLVAVVSDVKRAAASLRRLYPPLYEDEWRDDWAAFREQGPPQVDVVVTCEGSSGDAYHRIAWRVLASDEQLLSEYRELKQDPHDYEQRKAEFFDRIVARLEGAWVRRRPEPRAPE